MITEIKYLTKEEAIQAVTEEGNELEFCAPELQNNEDVVMAAIKNIPWTFKYASKALRSSKTFFMKAIHEGVATGFVFYSTKKIKSNIEVLTLLLDKSDDGWEFSYARGEVAFNKELAAKALLKWGNRRGAYASPDNSNLWERLEPTLQEFFPQDSWYEKAKSYLMQLEYQLEQEKQAELVAGGSTAEDEVVW